MALLRQRLKEACQNRSTTVNKAPDWSSLCNNVFDEYLDSDELFALPHAPDVRSRKYSTDSFDLFDFSGGSEQSNGTAETDATSPIPTWKDADQTSLHYSGTHNGTQEYQQQQSSGGGIAPFTDQPKPRKSLGFWGKTLRVLERSAAKNDDKQHKLRSAKSHPDFLSLGGCPSPPSARPVSPTEQTLSVQRRRARASANGNQASPTPHTAVTQETPTTTRAPSASAQRARSRHRASSSALRSVSRGRPTGITKHANGPSHASSAITAAASSYNPSNSSSCNPYATIRPAHVSRARHASLSPQKMMNPSRYRAGFKDVWADKLELDAKKHELSMPTVMHGHHRHHSVPRHDDFISCFQSPQPPPPTFNPLTAYDEPLSPLTSTFQQANIHTPHTSPHFSTAGAPQQSYFESLPVQSHQSFETHAVTLDGGPPIFPERSSSLATNRIQQFDFGFSSSSDEFEAWNTSAFGAPSGESAAYSSFGSQDQLVDFNGHNDQSHSSSQPGFDIGTGLGISGLSCNPSMLSGSNGGNAYTTNPDTAALPLNPYHIPSSAERSTLQTPMPNCSNDFFGPQSLPNYHHSHTQPSTPNRSRSYSSTPPPATIGPECRARRDSSRSRRGASRHRRVKSTNCTPRHSQNLEKGGFVNFTPQDSSRILSGVAPSGSSKTKARREKEAADKRRRLSQAAMKAVVEAGGDIEALQKAGLLT